MCTYLSRAHAGPWAGTYQVDADCDQVQCCCLVGVISVTVSNGLITLAGAVSGACGGFTSDIETVIAPVGDAAFNVRRRVVVVLFFSDNTTRRARKQLCRKKFPFWFRIFFKIFAKQRQDCWLRVATLI